MDVRAAIGDVDPFGPVHGDAPRIVKELARLVAQPAPIGKGIAGDVEQRDAIEDRVGGDDRQLGATDHDQIPRPADEVPLPTPRAQEHRRRFGRRPGRSRPGGAPQRQDQQQRHEQRRPNSYTSATDVHCFPPYLIRLTRPAKTRVRRPMTRARQIRAWASPLGQTLAAARWTSVARSVARSVAG